VETTLVKFLIDNGSEDPLVEEVTEAISDLEVGQELEPYFGAGGRFKVKRLS
jgi:hypothetical protein